MYSVSEDIYVISASQIFALYFRVFGRIWRSEIKGTTQETKG